MVHGVVVEAEDAGEALLRVLDQHVLVHQGVGEVVQDHVGGLLQGLPRAAPTPAAAHPAAAIALGGSVLVVHLHIWIGTILRIRK